MVDGLICEGSVIFSVDVVDVTVPDYWVCRHCEGPPRAFCLFSLSLSLSLSRRCHAAFPPGAITQKHYPKRNAVEIIRRQSSMSLVIFYHTLSRSVYCGKYVFLRIFCIFIGRLAIFGADYQKTGGKTAG